MCRVRLSVDAMPAINPRSRHRKRRVLERRHVTSVVAWTVVVAGGPRSVLGRSIGRVRLRVKETGLGGGCVQRRGPDSCDPQAACPPSPRHTHLTPGYPRRAGPRPQLRHGLQLTQFPTPRYGRTQTVDATGDLSWLWSCKMRHLRALCNNPSGRHSKIRPYPEDGAHNR